MSRARAAALLLTVAATSTLPLPAPAAASPSRPSVATSGPQDLLWVEVDEVGLGRLSRTRVLRWQVTAHLAGAPEGSLVVELAARGDLARTETGVLVKVESCSRPWSWERAECPGEASLLFPWHRVVPDADGEQVPAGRLTPTESQHLLVSLTLPDATADTAQRLRAEIGLGLTATGDDRFPPAPPSRPVTTPAPPTRPVTTPAPPTRPVTTPAPPTSRPTTRPTTPPDGPAPTRPPVGGPGDGPSPTTRPQQPQPPQPPQPLPPDGPVAAGPEVSGPGTAVTAAAGTGPAGQGAGPAGALARTGAALLPPLLLGLGAVAAGLLLAGAARWRP